MIKRSVSGFGAVIVGVVAGVGVSQIFAQQAGPSAASTSTGAAASPAPEPSGAESPRVRTRVRPEQEQEDDDDSAADPAEEGRRFRAAHALLLAAHKSSERRAGWAQASEESFESDFAATCENDCRVMKADCRLTSCTVELEWPSEALAMTSFARLLEQTFSVNCAVQIALPEPTGQTGPIRSEVYLDCANLFEKPSSP